MAAGQHHSLSRLDDATNDVDQRSLAGAVWAQQRKNFAWMDIQINCLERLVARRIGLGKVID